MFCVISRYHGGAFVVFSNALNENMEVLAVKGWFSSVIGGAPAAAVVFTREVNGRIAADPGVRELEAQLATCTDDAASASMRVKLAATRTAVRSDKLGEVAAEFEAIHNVERARRWVRSTRSFRRLIAPEHRRCCGAWDRPNNGYAQPLSSLSVQDRRLPALPPCREIALAARK